MVKRKIVSLTEFTLICVLLELTALCIVHRAFAQTVAGSISAINGNATITRGTTTILVASGTKVDVGDRLVTGADGSLTVTLSDGSQIELAESRTLTIDENTLDPNGARASTKLSLLNGLVRSVVRATGGSPNFEVHTPNAVAAVRGTDFEVDHQTGVHYDKFPGCTEFSHVSVSGGTVEVSNPLNPNAPSVEVKKGQKATIPCSGVIVVGAASLAGILSSMGTVGVAGAAVGGAGAAAVTGVAIGGGFSGGGSSPPPPSPADQ